ncbi:hypothetical protein L1281_001096 [Neisseria sp. HSC-16F19]|nr:hypothetical protein [Neisseria sp. HSC-16F19]MCP2040513.1 hypothetical protein [Neisseria sp. HSC-16F19]
MADTEAKAAKPRNKIRTIRIWLWVTALLFAGTFFLSQCAMSKPQAKGKIIEACIKNSPFNPGWEGELAKHGLTQSQDVVQNYCLCMWNDTLEAMSADEIKAFSQMDGAAKLEKLGGEQAVVARHQQCLAQQKPAS